MQFPQDSHNKRLAGGDPRTIPALKSNGTLSVPLALAGIQEVGDPAQWESVSQPWELLARPTGRGRFHNRKHFVVTPNCVLYAESFGAGFCVSGLTPAGMLGVTLPLYLGEASSYWGLQAALEEGVPACLPGVLDASIASGQRHLILLLGCGLLEERLGAETVAALRAAAALRRLQMTAVARVSLTYRLLGIIDSARICREVLGNESAVRRLEWDLVDCLAGAFAPPEVGHQRPDRSARRRALVRTAELVRYSDLGSLSAADLCRAAGVSERTLAYAFRESVGTSPMGFVRRLRLHRVRAELLMAEPGSLTVTTVAHALGFFEHGQFSAAYARAFGELPSETLARQANRGVVRLPVSTHGSTGTSR